MRLALRSIVLILIAAASCLAQIDHPQPPKEQDKSAATAPNPSFRYLIVRHGPFHDGRIVIVLTEPASLTETNLRELCRLVSRRFPLPRRLHIGVFTSLEQLPTPEEEDYDNSADADGQHSFMIGEKGYPFAVYRRDGDDEAFQYSNGKGTPQKTVIIRGKDPFTKHEVITQEESSLLAAPVVKKDLYPADADAKKEIEAALKSASADRKRVLLVFGGNWCYDCHVLDRALHEGEAGQIMNERFLLVHVDIGEDGKKNPDLAQKYKIPVEKGVPAVAVLGSDGALLYSSGDGEFEAARTMMRKDLVAFLKRWQETK